MKQARIHLGFSISDSTPSPFKGLALRRGQEQGVRVKFLQVISGLCAIQWKSFFSIAGVSARQPRSFCFGKRTQSHVGRGVVLRMPYAVRRPRRCANSLRLYGLFLSFLGSSGRPGVERHRFASASCWTDGLRLLPSTGPQRR